MLKKVLIGLAVLLVLLLAAAAVGPRFVDWNSYKPRVAMAVHDATGRDLAIDGNVSLSLLPSPTLSVEGVRFANLPGGSSPDMARLRSLDVRVALMPLLGGRIQVTRVTLVDPVILLERLPDGRANWQFTRQNAAHSGAAQSGAAQSNSGAAAGGGIAGMPIPAGGLGTQQISVDNFKIENGTLIYRSGGTPKRLDNLNATVVAPSLAGPFSADGDARLLGVPASFQISVGRIDAGGPIPTQASINIAGDAAMLRFDGTADQGALGVDGKLSAKLADPVLVMKLSGAGSLPPGLAQPFNLAGDIAASAAAVNLDNIALSLGDTSAAGKLAVLPGSPARVQLALTFNRLDIDKLLPAAAPAGGDGSANGGGEAGNAGGEGAGSAAPAPAAPPAASPAALGIGFALPGEIVADVDLSAEAVAYRKGVVSRPHVVARLANGQIEVRQAAALLPGDSDVSLAGSLAPKDGQPYFAGALQVKSRNLRDLMAWLGADLPRIPADRLRSLVLTSRVSASPTEAELADLDVKLDASHLQGGITVALPSKTRSKPGFGIGLTVDQLDLDAYLPAHEAGAGAPAPSSAPNPSPNPAPASTPTPVAAGKPASPLAGLAALAGVDANFDLRAGNLGLNSQTLRGLHLQGTIYQGKLTIADASVADLAGGQGSASGSIVDLASADPHYDLKLDIAAEDGARLFQFAGLGQSAPGKFGALKLNGAVKGGADNVDFDLAFAVSGLGVDGAAKGKAAGLQGGGPPRVDSMLNAKASNAGPLFQLLGLPADAAARLGAVSLTGKAASGTDSVDYDLALDLPGVGGKGRLQGKLTGLQGKPQTATTLKLDVAQPAPLLALAGVPGPAAGRLGPLGLSGQIDGGAEALKLGLDLTALGGKAAVQGNVAAAKTPIAFDLTVAADNPSFAKMMTALAPGYRPPGTDPGAFKLTAHLVGNAAKFALKDVALKAGVSDLAGTATVDLGGPRPVFSAGFTSSALDVGALGALGGGAKLAAPAPGQPPAAPGAQQTAPGAQQAAPAVSGRWSRQPLDLSALDQADGSLELKAAHLLLAGSRIDDLALRASLAGGTLAIQTMTGKAYGGSFALQNGKLVGRGLPSVSGHVATQNMEIAELARTSLVKGPVSVTADLAATGASEAELVASLQGHGKLAGQATILSSGQAAVGSALLEVLGSKIKQIRGVTDQIGGGFALFAGRPSELAGAFVIDHGVLTTKNTTLANPAARAWFHGDAHLAPWTLAMLADIYKLPEQQTPWISVDLQGSIDRPNVKASGAAFRQAPQQPQKPLQQLQQLLQPKSQPPSNPPPQSGPQPAPAPSNQSNPLGAIIQELLKKRSSP